MAARDRRPRLAKLTLPTLVVHGRQDIVLPLDNGAATHHALRGSRFLVVDNMGHNIRRHALTAVVDAIEAVCCEGQRRADARKASTPPAKLPANESSAGSFDSKFSIWV
jgi:hypothetical protein